MTVEEIDVAIIGAGTAGLSARTEVAKATDSYRVFDPGPYGTTCARTACMPSKAFLQSAHDFHRRHAFEALGIRGADGLSADGAAALRATRALRDRLVAGVIESMKGWRETHLVPHAPAFREDGALVAGGRAFRPRATIVATGARPVVPAAWRGFGDRVITSDAFFEMADLPRRMAVVGLGPVGLELGQALARLGVAVTAFDPGPTLGGLSDPEIQPLIREAMGREMRLVAAAPEPEAGPDGALKLRWAEGEAVVDRALLAIGRAPDLSALRLDRIGVALDDEGRPALEPDRLDQPKAGVWFAGDVASGPALLHEAADEGRLAGWRAVRGGDAAFRRRTPLRMVFTEPQIAEAGPGWAALRQRGDALAVGGASFDDTGRTLLSRAEGGAVRIYAEKATARLLGAAFFAPAAEHAAHLLAYALDQGADLRALLRAPVYHPTHEEVLRRALRDALAACDVEAEPLEAIRCEDAPVDCHLGG